MSGGQWEKEKNNAAYFSAATTEEVGSDNSNGCACQFQMFKSEMAR